MSKNRLRWRYAAGILLAWAFLALPVHAQEPLLVFVQTGDAQVDDPSEQALYEWVLDTIAAGGTAGALLPRPVDLVFLAGDLVDSPATSEWDVSLQTLHTRLTANGIPFLAVPGNHDRDLDNGFTLYASYVGDPGVWETGIEDFVGHNGVAGGSDWRGLRFIGFNNSSVTNNLPDGDVEIVEALVGAAAAAEENVFLLGHFPHDGGGEIPLQTALETPAVRGYMRGHTDLPHLLQGLAGTSNAQAWDLNSNSIWRDGAVIYYEVFETHIDAYLIQLDHDPTFPAPQTISLLHPLTSVLPPVVADFTGTPVHGSAPLGVAFTDQSTGDPTSWSWAFGDGETSAERDPLHSYDAPGLYTVTLTASNAQTSDTVTAVDYVTVTAPAVSTYLPEADARVRSSRPDTNYGSDDVLRVKDGSSIHDSYLRFRIPPLGPSSVRSARLRLYVTGGSDDGGELHSTDDAWTESGITWNSTPAWGAWLASAGPVSDGTWVELDVTAAVSGEGSHAFGLSNDSGDSAYYSSREGPNPPQLVVETGDPVPPTAAFTGTPAGGSVPLVVAFSDESGGAPDSWLWEFGDGETSTEQHPVHTYADPGTYTVSLTASNDQGSDVATAFDYVTAVPPPPITTFLATADSRVRSSEPDTNFGSDDRLRVKDGSSIYDSYLRFDVAGLGGSAVRSALLRLYVTGGSDDGGDLHAVDPGWKESGITWNTAPALGAWLGAAGAVSGGEWLEFDVTSLVRGDGSYAFGLSNDSGDSAYYSSREGGDPPQLVVETGDPVPPTAAFTGTPTAGPAPLVVAFSDESGGAPGRWLWEFGDGETSTLRDPVHSYADPGSYTVTLTASNEEGSDVASIRDYVGVTPPPPVQTFRAAADARVRSTEPDTNFGSDDRLRVKDGSSIYDSYLRFDVTGLGGAAVESAVLRVHAVDGSDDGGELYAVDTAWTETGITWNTAPAPGAWLGSSGEIPDDTWVELDVTPVVRGDGSFAFLLSSDSGNSAYYSSREGEKPPELVVTIRPQ